MNTSIKLKVFCLLLFIEALVPQMCCSGTIGEHTPEDWVFPQLLSMYATVLRDPNLTTSKNTYLAGFHNLAFEYWLISRTNNTAAPLRYRRFFRDLLHREAKSDIFWSDPCALLPKFANSNLAGVETPVGKLFGIMPFDGFDLQSLTEVTYRDLVSKFQEAFADFSEAFPTDPVFTGSIVKSTTGLSQNDVKTLTESFRNKKWQTVGFIDRLPLAFRENPDRAFKALTPEAQAYFMPAFLRMCEVGSTSQAVEGLPQAIVSAMTGDSSSATKLRTKLNLVQKRCVIGDFEAWYRNVSVVQLKREFGL